MGVRNGFVFVALLTILSPGAHNETCSLTPHTIISREVLSANLQMSLRHHAPRDDAIYYVFVNVWVFVEVVWLATDAIFDTFDASRITVSSFFSWIIASCDQLLNVVHGGITFF
jgi:hypothetical protein